ncbi:MAG: MltA domain-containing protein [Proteobacteria bacterium]|nr:MltA domain-containing protein [Pseudomonadota bacterium]
MIVPEKEIRFSDLVGWNKDNHGAAFDVFLNTKPQQKNGLLLEILNEAKNYKNPKIFFEDNFTPVLLGGQKEVLFTGYYEPVYKGSFFRDEEFKYPIYETPKDLPLTEHWFTRKQIDKEGVLEGRKLELVFLKSKAEVFFLHIQGSGRIILKDGSTLRVGYSASNGHVYTSIGKELVKRNVFSKNTISQKKIMDWIMKDTEAGNELMYKNLSYVFFKKLNLLTLSDGPIGTLELPITPLRSIAVDPETILLGSPVWIEKKGKKHMNRLMIAMDTGSAIKGIGRVDIYYGTGDIAGTQAGEVRDSGRMVVLKPKSKATRGLKKKNE